MIPGPIADSNERGRFRLVGLVSLRDTVRPEAGAVLRRLRADGVRCIVTLTGDHPEVASAVAAELGITEWQPKYCPNTAATRA